MKEQLRWVYDLETYPNIWTMTVVREDGKFLKKYEISDRNNDTEGLLNCLRYFRKNKTQMIGYNNTGFDYPILHKMLQMAITAKSKCVIDFKFNVDELYKIAQEQIASFKGPFGNTIREKDCLIPQLDLYKIHHFDNVAKATSLKMLEFNMKSESIQDLPFPVGTVLNDKQKDLLLYYNAYDVMQTLKFYHLSKEAIDFRVELGKTLGFSVLNFNDTKIGKEYFAKKLEEQMPGSCYTLEFGKRKLNQTPRAKIIIKNVLFDYYDFKRPEFIAIFKWFSDQIITETKGVFSDIEEHDLGDVAKYAELRSKRQKIQGIPSDSDKIMFLRKRPKGWFSEETLKAKKAGVHLVSYWKNWRVVDTLNVVIDGFRFDFGTGGIHGSLDSAVVKADDEYCIVDADVSSMYPNIAIVNRVYPEHLSDKFCDIYQDVYNQRKSYDKGTPQNAVMKLALNGVYGDSNNKYSPFYDPAYTMAITINGQLSLCLLAEKLLDIENLSIIQVNTDGITVKMPRESREQYDLICKEWQNQVKLDLEFADYSAMYVRDVNNYIAVYTNGKVKRKGAYQYEGLGWHQNHSALIVPKAAEAYILRGDSIEDFVKNATEEYDFMLRTKVDRSSKLVLVTDEGEIQQQNICRYYPSVSSGGQLVKIMKPLVGKTEDRRLSIDAGWNMKICNELSEFNRKDVNYDYYVQAAKKLILE